MFSCSRCYAARQLATGFLIDHPAVLLITPLILTAFSILSLPFLTLVLRLLLIGYYRHPREHTYIWHVRPYAGWLIALVTGAWLWTWVILRSIGRVVVAAVLGEWYFHRWVHRHAADSLSADWCFTTGPTGSGEEKWPR